MAWLHLMLVLQRSMSALVQTFRLARVMQHAVRCRCWIGRCFICALICLRLCFAAMCLLKTANFTHSPFFTCTRSGESWGSEWGGKAANHRTNSWKSPSLFWAAHSIRHLDSKLELCSWKLGKLKTGWSDVKESSAKPLSRILPLHQLQVSMRCRYGSGPKS